MKGKRALVTGSAAGIGKSVAYRFAEAGAALELVDVDEGGLEAAKDELSRFSVEVNLHRVDLSEKQEIDALWEKLSGREPDVLVNNAGIYPFRRFLEVHEAFLRKVLDVNLNSVVWMCQHMIRRRPDKGGVIVNVSSIEAVVPFEKNLAHYDASKAGVIAFTRSLAKEYGRRGFRVNVVLPGGIMTQGMKNVAKELVRFKMGILTSGIEFRRRLPLGRFGQPDGVARVVLFLASDISSYVHGALIAVDGGFLSA